MVAILIMCIYVSAHAHQFLFIFVTMSVGKHVYFVFSVIAMGSYVH